LGPLDGVCCLVGHVGPPAPGPGFKVNLSMRALTRAVTRRWLVLAADGACRLARPPRVHTGVGARARVLARRVRRGPGVRRDIRLKDNLMLTRKTATVTGVSTMCTPHHTTRDPGLWLQYGLCHSSQLHAPPEIRHCASPDPWSTLAPLQGGATCCGEFG
jgi:hypothetical protein